MKYLNYFFFKRTWFRALVILLPTWMIPLTYILFIYFPGFLHDHEFLYKNLLCCVYFITIFLALHYNDNIDCPPNPFKTKKEDNDPFKIY